MANQDFSTTLYSGLYTAKFSNALHRYYINGALKPGVTTIISQTIAKPDLMSWPLNMAMRHLRGKVGATLRDEDIADAYSAHTIRKDLGASTGTIVHELVEELLRSGDNNRVYPTQTPPVRAAMRAFQLWYETAKPETLAVENLVYSASKQYCGTFDSVLRIGGKVYLCDLKTTNAGRNAPQGVYPEYFIQLGFYLYAYAEQRTYERTHGGSDLQDIDGLMIISCKKDGKLDIVTNDDAGLSLDDCITAAICTRELYNMLTKTKKILGGV